MKVSIGYRIQDGPWGGGNNFVNSLTNYVLENNNIVIDHLNDDDIDIILIIDPRWNNPAVTFLARDVARYLSKRNNRTVVVHRINECDERKNTKLMNLRLKLVNCASDHTVFIASWLKHLNLWNPSINNSSIILNGADKSIFNMNNKEPWHINKKLKLVTHHWAGNHMKGFDVYSKIDDMLSSAEWNDKISFTYIGNLPNGFEFKNSSYYPPIQGEELATQLKNHHVYITGSINEPAGMHHIEGANCGLPLLYRNSGALPEYCKNYGLEFELDNLPDMISRIMSEYEYFYKKIKSYPHTSNKMCSEYIKLFNKLINEKDSYIKRRDIYQNKIIRFLSVLSF